jgi:hypothetical protein
VVVVKKKKKLHYR